MSCSVCCDSFNGALRVRVACEFSGDCPYDACKSCWRTYFLNTTLEPHCMQCKKAFSPKFQVLQFNRSFLETDYKLHRRTLLLDREISKLPETMPAAARQADIEVEEGLAATLLEKASELGRQIHQLYEQRSMCHNRIRDIRNRGRLGGTGAAEAETERRRFIMPCPNNDCRGFLSTQYKCELCKLFTCNECHEIIGHTKTDPHTCDPNNVQSAELIKRDTKPCPCCGTRISKISGCDQMWCPECHKAFSWRTGIIDTGVVHNPHFYQHQQQVQQNDANGVTGGGAAAAAAAQRRCLAGGADGGTDLCGWFAFNQAVLSKLRESHLITLGPGEQTLSDLRDVLVELHRSLSHILQVSVPELRTKVRELSNHEEMRVKYILKRCDKDELAAHIYRCDTLRQKSTEILHVLELFGIVGSETFERLLGSTLRGKEFYTEVQNQLAQLDKLRLYCNKQLSAVSATYNQSVPQMKPSFEMYKVKFSIKSQKALERAQAQEAEQAPQ